jgi:beta-lactamase class A
MTPKGHRHPRRAPASWWSRHGRWVLPLGGVLIIVEAAIVTFRVAPSAVPPSTPAQPVVQATSDFSAPGRAAELSAAAPVPAGLAGDFARLQTGLHAKTGVVVRPVGAPSVSPLILGDWSFGPAWSTIKVPLVIAAMRQQHTSQPTPMMTAVITESDNAGAESIWESLGGPAAATKVGAVLHATGDPTTVESRKLRPEYSAFGQTVWSLANQALFCPRLPATLATSRCWP